jgi:hypothetical protein
MRKDEPNASQEWVSAGRGREATGHPSVLWAHLCGLREQVSGSAPISCADGRFCSNSELIEAALGIGWVATVRDASCAGRLEVLESVE